MRGPRAPDGRGAPSGEANKGTQSRRKGANRVVCENAGAAQVGLCPHMPHLIASSCTLQRYSSFELLSLE